MAVKPCECGCGEPAPIALRNEPRFGYVKGQPLRFIRFHQARVARKDGCSRCGEPRADRQRYCADCRLAYARENRKPTCEFSPEQRLKSIARSSVHYYVRRGLIERKPCVRCGSPKSEGHHPDYREKLRVVWLCRRCHLDHHREQGYQTIEGPIEPPKPRKKRTAPRIGQGGSMFGTR